MKRVVGFEKWYSVTEDGKVFSHHRDVWLTPYKVGAGYHRVSLFYHGKSHNKYVHRIVAETFLGPANGQEINHKNGDKTDNRVANLEWVTRSQNNQHKHYELGHAIKPVTATCLTTSNVRLYASVEKTKADGFEPKHVSAVCLGKRKMHKGWTFEFTSPQPAQQQACDSKTGESETQNGLKFAGETQAQQQCNPHPKAPHGFDRNSSHSADRYVCECESWDAYDAGYQAGFEKGLMSLEDEQPAQQQEPVPSIIQMLGHCPECGAKAHHFTSSPANANAGKPWVGLSEEERGQVYANWRFNGSKASNLELCRAIEAKLKEKNAQPTKPLTPAEINYIESRWDACIHGSKIAFVVRETEAAHGIKE